MITTKYKIYKYTKKRNNMLKVDKLTKEFISGDEKVNAVRDINMDVPNGVFSLQLLVNPLAAKARCFTLGALDKPTSGTIEVDGREVSKMDDRSLIKYRRDKIGFVFQNYNLIPNLTALENVMLPMEFAG